MPNFFILSQQVLGVNGQKYIHADYTTGLVAGPNDPQTVQRQISTQDTVIVNSFWLIPKVQNGFVIGYTEETAINTSVPPTPDSIKILRIKDLNDNSEYDLAINNSDNVATSSPPNVFAYDANGLGGSLPVMPNVDIPFPIIQFPPTSADGTNNTFTFQFPANPLGLKYLIPAPWFNGVLAAPVTAADNITTLSGFVTLANSRYSTQGTWANPGSSPTIITLTSAVTNVTKAGLIVALNPKSYCFDLSAFSSPANVNQIKFGTGGLISMNPFVLTNSNVALQSQLQQKLSQENTTYGTAVAHKLQVNCLYDTPKLYYNGSLVVASTAGVCS